ncbi:MAG TPA: OmpA family protein [Terriglobales bacterium]|nr:OmpA family protein [Terriglobales bacterium]
MKLTFLMSGVPMILLAVATSVAASPPKVTPERPQAETGRVQPNLQLWKDPDVIEGLKDILFDFDTHESAAEHAILQANAQWLKDHPNVRFKLAGYTDPRGDIVYNLVLSQRRAETVKRELIQLGIAENRIVFATGWGELYPNCLESTEECWEQTRRVEFVHASE